MHYLIFLTLLTACQGSSFPIKDLVHAENITNINISDIKDKITDKIVANRDKDAEHHEYMHREEQKMMAETIDRLRELHKYAEEASVARYNDLLNRVEKIIHRHGNPVKTPSVS